MSISIAVSKADTPAPIREKDAGELLLKFNRLTAQEELFCQKALAKEATLVTDVHLAKIKEKLIGWDDKGHDFPFNPKNVKKVFEEIFTADDLANLMVWYFLKKEDLQGNESAPKGSSATP